MREGTSLVSRKRLNKYAGRHLISIQEFEDREDRGRQGKTVIRLSSNIIYY